MIKREKTFFHLYWSQVNNRIFLDPTFLTSNLTVSHCFIFKYYVNQQKKGGGNEQKRKRKDGEGGDGLTWACQIQSITGKEGLWELIPNETKSFAYAEVNATGAYIHSQESTSIIQSTYFLTTQHGNKTQTVFINKEGLWCGFWRAKPWLTVESFPHTLK